MKNIYDLSKFENNIIQIEMDSNDILKTSFDAIELCNRTLMSLKKKILTHQFFDESSEIKFFKETKQIPLRYLIYYTEILTIETSFPKTNTLQKKYLLKKATKINAFLMNNRYFVQYNKLGQVNMDNLYFTRQYTLGINYGHECSYFQDTEFNTTHDRLLAKIKAFELLAEYIQSRLITIQKVSYTIDKNDLKWTSSKISLTELTYALHHSNSINNGQAGINQIAHALQQAFNFELGDYIEIRKR